MLSITEMDMKKVWRGRGEGEINTILPCKAKEGRGGGGKLGGGFSVEINTVSRKVTQAQNRLIEKKGADPM